MASLGPRAKKPKLKWDQEYVPEWESDPALTGWLTESKRTPAYCTLCNKDLDYRSGGIYDLKRHASREAHLRAVRARETEGDVVRAFTRKQDASMSAAVSNAVLKAAFFLAEHHVAISTADHMIPLMAAMFPDSRIASEMKCGRTKMTAAIKCIAENMHDELVGLMSGGFFSLIPDESTDVAVKEQVAIAVRLFDEKSGKVRTLSYGVPRHSRRRIFVITIYFYMRLVWR